MAKDKKGFILYADQKELFDQLPNDKAGELIKFIFAYVNDDEPVTDDLLINLAFTPIKQQLKRDLDKWENTRGERSKAGKASAEARRNKREQEATKATSVEFVQQNSTKATVNDNVTVTVNVNDINKESFDIFWTKYPKKIAKPKCLQKWNRLKQDDRDKILNTIDTFLEYKPFKDYTHPNPLTYLNNERWNDVIETPQEAKIVDPLVEYVKQNIARYGNS